MVVVLPNDRRVAQVLRYSMARRRGGPARRRHALSAAPCRSATACSRAWPVSTRIREIDLANRVGGGRASGRRPSAISTAVGDERLLAPDPSSQIACTIGGNVAENSGGSLPEIRPHHQQRARRRNGADDRRDTSGSAASTSTRAASTCSASSSARKGLLERRDRGHGAHPEEAGDRARDAGRLPLRPRTPATALPGAIGGRASFRAAWR